jgi:hypothetical protein
MASAYNINYLITACGEIDQVVVLESAQKTAREDFNLQTKKAVINFISNNGLESLYYINTKHWENNPNKNCPIMVDAYSFYSGPTHGYIAFFFNPKTNKWLIKSFKLNRNSAPRNNKFIDQLSVIKALMQETEEK